MRGANKPPCAGQGRTSAFGPPFARGIVLVALVHAHRCLGARPCAPRRYTRSGVDTVQPVPHEPYGIQLDVAGYQKYLEEKARLGQAQSNIMKMTI